MKNQYILGMIAGASLMLALLLFMGSSRKDVGRYQSFTADGTRMIDTKTGEVFRAVKQETPFERLSRRHSQQNVTPLERLEAIQDKKNN